MIMHSVCHIWWLRWLSLCRNRLVGFPEVGWSWKRSRLDINLRGGGDGSWQYIRICIWPTNSKFGNFSPGLDLHLFLNRIFFKLIRVDVFFTVESKYILLWGKYSWIKKLLEGTAHNGPFSIKSMVFCNQDKIKEGFLVQMA